MAKYTDTIFDIKATLDPESGDLVPEPMPMSASGTLYLGDTQIGDVESIELNLLPSYASGGLVNTQHRPITTMDATIPPSEAALQRLRDFGLSAVNAGSSMEDARSVMAGLSAAMQRHINEQMLRTLAGATSYEPGEVHLSSPKEPVIKAKRSTKRIITL